jgi:hypothetical protein
MFPTTARWGGGIPCGVQLCGGTRFERAGFAPTALVCEIRRRNLHESLHQATTHRLAVVTVTVKLTGRRRSA